MSLTQHKPRDFKCFQHNLTGIININHLQAVTACRLHSTGTLTFTAFAAPATEETVIVEGSATTQLMTKMITA